MSLEGEAISAMRLCCVKIPWKNSRIRLTSLQQDRMNRASLDVNKCELTFLCNDTWSDEPDVDRCRRDIVAERSKSESSSVNSESVLEPLWRMEKRIISRLILYWPALPLMISFSLSLSLSLSVLLRLCYTRGRYMYFTSTVSPRFNGRESDEIPFIICLSQFSKVHSWFLGSTVLRYQYRGLKTNSITGC